MQAARPRLLSIRWTSRSEPAGPFLVLPVKRQGLAYEPVERQVDGLGALQDGALDLGCQKSEGCAGSDESIVMPCGAGDFLEGKARLERAGPATRLGERIPEHGFGLGERDPGDELHLDPTPPQADRDAQGQRLWREVVRCNAEPMRHQTATGPARPGVLVAGDGRHRALNRRLQSPQAPRGPPWSPSTP